MRMDTMTQQSEAASFHARIAALAADAANFSPLHAHILRVLIDADEHDQGTGLVITDLVNSVTEHSKRVAGYRTYLHVANQQSSGEREKFLALMRNGVETGGTLPIIVDEMTGTTRVDLSRLGYQPPRPTRADRRRSQRHASRRVPVPL
jgi:hypothetical protein